MLSGFELFLGQGLGAYAHFTGGELDPSIATQLPRPSCGKRSIRPRARSRNADPLSQEPQLLTLKPKPANCPY
ncbi:MAG: hypothetical protein R2710_06310 [Acidimicrobiales bacterium]